MADEEEKQIVQHYHSPKNIWDAVIQPVKTAGQVLLLIVFMMTAPVCGVVCGDCAGCVDMGEVLHGKAAVVQMDEGL